MPGPKPKYAVQLAENEIAELRQLIKARKTPQGQALRARIVLAAHEHPEWTNQEIARQAGCTDRTVRTWRQRWATQQPLEDLPRSGRPRRFSPEVRAQATAVACSLPQEKGQPFRRWSLAEIVSYLVHLGLVVQIATSTVCRWFAAAKLKPWRYHSWQHIRDPKAFLERACPVLWLYERAKALLQEGIWVVSGDEKTSIQARQMEDAPQSAAAGYPVHVCSRYRRQGALQLFAGLSVADGLKYGQVMARKRFVDFQSFVLHTIVPEAVRRGVHTVKLILDNSTTHAPKQLQRWLDEQACAAGWPMAIEVVWLPTHASWLNQIEIWFSVLQRKVLQPNHFNTLEELTTTIMDFIQYENQHSTPIQWTYTVEQLTLKLGTN